MESSPVSSSVLPDALARFHPLWLVLAVHADSVAPHFVGPDGFPGSIDETIIAILRQDPDAEIVVYGHDPSLKYQMLGPTGVRGHDWYVLCEPIDKPRLVRSEKSYDYHPRRLVRGVDLDTGETVENLEILYVLGKDAEAIAPLLRDPMLRVHPPHHLPKELRRFQG